MTRDVLKTQQGPPWCVYLELSCGHTVLYRRRKQSLPKKVKCEQCDEPTERCLVCQKVMPASQINAHFRLMHDE